MAQINNYPPPPGPLAGTENLVGQDAGGTTRRVQVSDITDLTDYTLLPIKSDGSRAMTGPLVLSGAPTAPDHAVPKSYVDEAISAGSGDSGATGEWSA